MVVGASLVVLLFSTFVLSRLEASFPMTAPWCSQSVRHRGGTDAKEEQSAASRYENKGQKMSDVEEEAISELTLNVHNIKDSGKPT